MYKCHCSFCDNLFVDLHQLHDVSWALQIYNIITFNVFVLLDRQINNGLVNKSNQQIFTVDKL